MPRAVLDLWRYWSLVIAVPLVLCLAPVAGGIPAIYSLFPAVPGVIFFFRFRWLFWLTLQVWSFRTTYGTSVRVHAHPALADLIGWHHIIETCERYVRELTDCLG